MKKYKIMFWTATILYFLFQGVMPALTGNTELAKEGVRHLGYPDYFRVALNVAKVTGSLALIIPQVPARIKEWAYAGFTFDFIFATISLISVDGFNGTAFLPLVSFVVLMISYVSYHKLKAGVAENHKYSIG